MPASFLPARPYHTIHHALGPVRKADLTGAQSSIPHTDASHSPYIRAGEEGDGEADLTGDARVQGPVRKGVVQQAPAGGLQATGRSTKGQAVRVDQQGTRRQISGVDHKV